MNRGIATIGELIGGKPGTTCRGCNVDIEAGTFFCVPCCSRRFCRSCGDEVEVERVRLLNSRTCIACAKAQDTKPKAKGVGRTVAMTGVGYIQDELIPESAFCSGHRDGDEYTENGVAIINAEWYKRRGRKAPSGTFTSGKHRRASSKRNKGHIPKGGKRTLDKRAWNIYQKNKEPRDMLVRG